MWDGVGWGVRGRRMVEWSGMEWSGMGWGWGRAGWPGWVVLGWAGLAHAGQRWLTLTVELSQAARLHHLLLLRAVRSCTGEGCGVCERNAVVVCGVGGGRGRVGPVLGASVNGVRWVRAVGASVNGNGRVGTV